MFLKRSKYPKKFAAGVLAIVMALGCAVSASAATVHYNDSSVSGDSAEWQAWVNGWEELSGDYTQVSLTPGKDETELNFAWYSKVEDGKAATPVVHSGTDENNMAAFTGTYDNVDDSLTGGVQYVYNYVTVTGLKENTSYVYTVEKNGVETEPAQYQTNSFSTVKMLYVGDPQIGASKGQPQNGEKLVETSGAANTAAENDGFAWNRTLEIATAQNPDISFIISAGDQVNNTGKAKEEEYAAYLSPSVLQSIPVATTIGNHDSLNADYMYHFNNPNATEYGMTEAGGDYYYSYGEGLFIVLNTNNYNVAEHEKTIQEAVASDPDAAWRIVTFHQDIYGTGLDHSDTDGMILRTQLTPIFDAYDIDVVLQGHDHTYSRSELLYGDGLTHGSYEFQLLEDGSDYDWDHAYDVITNNEISLFPSPNDAESVAELKAFQQDNLCYTIESTNGTTVVNPVGILYMTANSASGSKFYELVSPQQDYIAVRSQNWLPSYSVITMSADSFSIITYQITDEGKVEPIDESFTIVKDPTAPANAQEPVIAAASITMGGTTYYRLRDVAATASGTSSQFDVIWNGSVVITTGAAYKDYIPTGTCEGTLTTLNVIVNGQSVTTDAVVAGGNNFVPASFLSVLGITI